MIELTTAGVAGYPTDGSLTTTKHLSRSRSICRQQMIPNTTNGICISSVDILEFCFEVFSCKKYRWLIRTSAASRPARSAEAVLRKIQAVPAGNRITFTGITYDPIRDNRFKTLRPALLRL